MTDDTTPEGLLGAIRPLYRQLQAIPYGDPAYRAIEARIHAYSKRYMAVVHAELDALQERAEAEARQAARRDEHRTLQIVPPRPPSSSTAVPCDPTKTTPAERHARAVRWTDDAERDRFTRRRVPRHPVSASVTAPGRPD